MNEDDRNLSDPERRALRALGDGPEPPPALETATVRRLSEGGAFRTRRAPWRSGLAAAAAGLALFGLGLAIGARRASPARPAVSASPRFVLLLYDSPDERNLTDAQMNERVTEYIAWARQVRAAGREITGQKLDPRTEFLGPGDARPRARIGGYFVISARDMDAAVAVARTCPHVKYGGLVEVRAVART
jgi:hypothetical protein